MVPKYISSKAIIGNVLRDNTYQGQDIQYSDIIEWIAEACEAIAAPRAYLDDIECITIKDYRGLLPCNLHRIVQAFGSINGSNIFPLKASTDTLHPTFNCFVEASLIPQNEAIISDENPIGTDINGNPVWNYVGSNTDYTAMPPTHDVTANYHDSTYKVNDNYIFPSFREGKIYLAYKSIMVDKEGYPKIPDIYRYRKAVESYIRERLDYRMWRRGEINDKLYAKSEQEWLWYVGSAQNAMLIPTLDEMESLKDQFVRLIPRLNEHSNHFKTLNQQEQLRLGQRIAPMAFNNYFV